ncbi:hypothetical protein E0Y77_21820 [Salmonella enterica subsp. enterica serovar Miami]|nr:hypothetical protein [Salmonella enterica]EBV0974497.1 hypothetical protein [Salmonella enterica subsp. enterica serovar Miami]ECT4851960.1 hypothetical protein [Salmonella enterica subsp. enterica serovar Saintpaul]ECU4133273.1 hypothetical protein [Salmonella enterica subsp. enterica serovar Thompson]EDX5655364.1 hypothetical protein [Salmonella enterica subsp. enterica serovar Mississippi]
MPSLSGKGQKIACCPKCQITLWSHYSGSSNLTFLRVGTLDYPEHMPPDIHIYTESKQPWVTLPEDAITRPQFLTLILSFPVTACSALLLLRLNKWS